MHTLPTYSPYSRTLPYDDSDLLCFTLHVFALADQLPAAAQQLEFYLFHIYFEVLLVSEHCHPFIYSVGFGRSLPYTQYLHLHAPSASLPEFGCLEYQVVAHRNCF